MSDAPVPWTAGTAPLCDGWRDGRRHAPATQRNRDVIAAVLRDVLPRSGLVLEVASGSGEHVVHFAACFAHLDWQPSDPDPAAVASIMAWRAEAGLANVRAPMALDAAAEAWPVARADAIMCINMVHISPWAATVGLFRGAASVLSVGAPLILYGPFVEAGVETAASNLAFDKSLRARNPAWGLRSVADIDQVAGGWGFDRVQRVAMPANNVMLVYKNLTYPSPAGAEEG